MRTCRPLLILMLLMLPGFVSIGFAQLLPPNQPEQDACNALVLCGSSFTSPYSYQGVGTLNNLGTTPCGSGEDNSVWLKLTASTSGTLVFSIAPVSPQDDYDFAVLDISGTTCSSLSSANVVRCNFNNNQPGSNVNGVIGLNTTSTLSYVAGGTFGSSFCQQLNVTAGQVFLIMINNYGNYASGGPSSGFTINFAGSTATFNTPPPPQLQSILVPVCNYKSEITIQLSSEVKCSSIAANGSDFYLSPSGTITAAQGINCSGSSGYTDKVKLTFSPALPPGNYTVHAQQGTDGNTLLDLCNNPLALPAQLSFTVRELAKTVTMTRCTSQMPFTWNGINVTAGGPAAAVAHHTTTFGCDSVTTLNLTVSPSVTATVNAGVCSNQLPYLWNGINVAAGGPVAATFTSTSSGGCDSVTTLNLTVKPVYTGAQTVNICSSQLPYTWNGIVVPAGGTGIATYTGTRANGCDSTVTLNLVVHPPYTGTVNRTICANQLPYTWNGIVVAAGGAGAATYHGTTTWGCDSAVTLNLTVNPLYSDTAAVTICSNQLPYTWNGIVVPAGGTAVATYHGTTALGCDSAVSLSLTVKPVSALTVSRTICSNQLPYLWNGISVTGGGPAAASYTTTGSNGCDSVVTLSLIVTPVVQHTVSMIKCAADMPFTWNGITVNAGGTAAATFTGTSAANCDSIVKLNLVVQQPSVAVLSAHGCNQAIFEGNTYTSSQVVYDTLHYTTGCDSLRRTINITVYPTNPVTVNKDTAACGQLVFNGITYTSSTSVTQTFLTVQGCDSLYLVTAITIHPNTPASLVIDTAACDEVVFEGSTYTSDATLTRMFTNHLGCDSLLRTVNVRPQHFRLNLVADPREIVNGEYVQLTTSANTGYHPTDWYPSTYFPDQQALGQRVQPPHDETFWVIARSDLGCIDSAQIAVRVDTLVADAFMPNAFSPNGDGLNDRFIPGFFNQRGYSITMFRIFNRWGQEVYNGSGKNTQGWDGTYHNQGKPADGGTYYYVLKVTFLNGKEKIMKGDVQLIR
ncbi:gliding motility-associated C-terminal domain-containing protein [Taibaiella koreensis]|uniref:gliding motility-associated C-terminal domain-containing protein n=1 Tax=Taibaiella koreensis TaxID=1268548 RepID=UPI000E59C07D|nr:gliding motility-associated C-terminal domain-containing protein [Taibaiella koreensis]